MTDANLLGALQKVTDIILREYPDAEERAEKLRKFAQPLRDLAEPVKKALAEHPKFKTQVWRFFGHKQLGGDYNGLPFSLTGVSVERGPKEAIKWLYKIYETKIADIRYVYLIHGLQTKRARTFKNGVKLIPLNLLPDSKMSRAAVKQFANPLAMPMAAMFPPMAAIFQISSVEGSSVYPAASNSAVPSLCDKIERTVKAFTLIEKMNPAIGISWT